MHSPSFILVAMKDFPQTIHFVLIGVGAFFQLFGEVVDVTAASTLLCKKNTGITG